MPEISTLRGIAQVKYKEFPTHTNPIGSREPQSVGGGTRSFNEMGGLSSLSDTLPHISRGAGLRLNNQQAPLTLVSLVFVVIFQLRVYKQGSRTLSPE